MTDQIETTPIDDAAAATSGSRRALLGKGAMVAVAATAVGLAGSRSASAAPGADLVVGLPANASDGLTTTGLTGGSSLLVVDGTTEAIGTGATAQGASVVGRQALANGIGVIGEHTGVPPTPGGTIPVGTGVLAISNAGSGVVARGSVADVEANGSGKLLLSTVAYTAIPTGASLPGTIGRDAAGNLYYSPVSGEYILLAGPAAPASFFPISPARVYDSRLDGATKPKIKAGENRTISVANALNETTGAVMTQNVVPEGATAVVYNLTVTETTGELGGFLSVVPGDATALAGSSINWSGVNQNIANGGTIKLSPTRTVKVFAGGAPAPTTHFIIDVTGYYA